jgi:hypothetical protein
VRKSHPHRSSLVSSKFSPYRPTIIHYFKRRRFEVKRRDSTLEVVQIRTRDEEALNKNRHDKTMRLVNNNERNFLFWSVVSLLAIFLAGSMTQVKGYPMMLEVEDDGERVSPFDRVIGWVIFHRHCLSSSSVPNPSTFRCTIILLL